jgi:Mobilization protein NikA
VRFAHGEIGQVERAATAAGLPLSTYIRMAALSAAANIDVEAARRELLKATRALEELGKNLDGSSRRRRQKRAA